MATKLDREEWLRRRIVGWRDATGRLVAGATLFLLLTPGCAEAPPRRAPPAAPLATLVLEPPRIRLGDVAVLELAVITPPGHAPRPLRPPQELPGLWLLDAEALPPGILESADLSDPATTVALLGLNAVVGVQAVVNQNNQIEKLGITCALCHTDVDNSVLDGIGKRLDGWPNRDLNVGAIVALSPALPDDVKAVLNSWGPGKYDAYLSHDGINDPVLIPPAYGLRGVGLETYSGEGPISYWNAYVAVTQMHGQGSFSDPRLGIDIETTPDLVTPKLPALRAYQLSLTAPKPPAASFDRKAAKRGRKVFFGSARCANCHLPPTYSDAPKRLHDPSIVGTDPLRASRGTTGQYRATPLRGAWQRAPYFHDGSAATLADVVAHYERQFGLGLLARQSSDLVEFLKSL